MSIKEICIEFAKAAVTMLAIWFGVFTVFTRYFEKNETIPVDFAFILMSLPIILSLILSYLVVRIYLRSKISFPAVIQYFESDSHTGPSSKNRIFLLSPSDLFGSGIHCSMYLLDNNLEVLLGDGYVINIQGDKKIQVILKRIVNSELKIWDSIRQNQPETIQKLRIKPGRQAVDKLGDDYA